MPAHCPHDDGGICSLCEALVDALIAIDRAYGFSSMKNKPDYKLFGSVVPAVTSVVKRFDDKEGLLYWAWKQGTQGIDFRETRDDAGLIGDVAHGIIQDFIRSTMTIGPSGFKAPPISMICKRFRVSEELACAGEQRWNKWLDWYLGGGNRFRFLESELRLVSEAHGYGGTLDCIAEEGGKLVLLDWKTGKSVHDSFLHQIAAYAILYEEHFGKCPEEWIIVHIPAIGKAKEVRIKSTVFDYAKHTFLVMLKLFKSVNVKKWSEEDAPSKIKESKAGTGRGRGSRKATSRT